MGTKQHEQLLLKLNLTETLFFFGRGGGRGRGRKPHIVVSFFRWFVSQFFFFFFLPCLAFAVLIAAFGPMLVGSPSTPTAGCGALMCCAVLFS